MEDSSSMDWGAGEECFQNNLNTYIYCELYFYYYYISSTSYHRVFDSGLVSRAIDNDAPSQKSPSNEVSGTLRT